MLFTSQKVGMVNEANFHVQANELEYKNEGMLLLQSDEKVMPLGI